MTITQEQTTAATATVKTPTTDELVARAAELIPLIREKAQQAEDERRVTEEVIQAIQDAGLYKIAVPKRFGGYEMDIITMLRVSAELGKGDASAAWVTTLMNVCNWIAGLANDQTREDIWGQNPDARVCGVLAPSGTTKVVDGGYIVNGKWGFASGSLHSQWATLGVPLVNEAGEAVDQGTVLVPMEDLRIEDTWYVAGMRGTGSNTLVAEDVFVPNHRVMSVTQAVGGAYPNTHDDEPLYRSALVPVLAIVLAAPPVGMAKHAMEIVRGSLAKGRGISYTFYDKSVLAPTTQLQVAEAMQDIDTAELHLLRAGADIDEAAQAGEYLDFEKRARVRADVATTVRAARRAVDTLLNVHGAGSFAEANPMQRVWRDLETASRHAIVNPEVSMEIYGRATLGVQEQVTALI